MFLGHQIYEELKNLIGEEATRKIANRFNGGRLYFPTPREISPKEKYSCSDCPFARDFAAFQKRLRSLKSIKPIKIKPSKPFQPSKPVFLK